MSANCKLVFINGERCEVEFEGDYHPAFCSQNADGTWTCEMTDGEIVEMERVNISYPLVDFRYWEDN